MAPSSHVVNCFFDGACKGNQFDAKGPMWAAFVVGEEEYVREVPDLPTAAGPLRSNNIAEYLALLLLLSRLRELVSSHTQTRYVVNGDSQLVVYQMLARYRVREPHLVPLHDQARRLAAELPVRFRWVPREENRAGQLLERS